MHTDGIVPRRLPLIHSGKFLCSVFPRPVVGVNSQLPLSSWIVARLRDSGKGKPCQVQTANIKQAWQAPLLLQAWQWFKVLFHLRRWQAAKCMQIYFTYSQMELIEAACRCHGDYRLLEQLCELLPPLGSLYVCTDCSVSCICMTFPYTAFTFFYCVGRNLTFHNLTEVQPRQLADVFWFLKMWLRAFRKQ